MSDFATLPGQRVNYPIAHFQPLPQPAVIPWAELAKQISDISLNVADRLNPEERKMKELQLGLMGSRVSSQNLENELNQLKVDQTKKAIADQRAGSSATQKGVDAIRAVEGGTDSGTPSQQAVNPPATNLPTTSNGAYYGGDSSSDLPGSDIPMSMPTRDSGDNTMSDNSLP